MGGELSTTATFTHEVGIMGNGNCIKLILQLLTALGECSGQELKRIEAGPAGVVTDETT